MKRAGFARKATHKRLGRKTELAPGDTALKRSTALRQGERGLARSELKPRTKRIPGKQERDEASERFWHAVTGGKARCVMCGSRRHLDAHHALPKQAIKRIIRSWELSPHDYWRLVYAPEVGVAACEDCHASHTAKLPPIPASKIPASVFAFVERTFGREGVAAIGREHR